MTYEPYREKHERKAIEVRERFSSPLEKGEWIKSMVEGRRRSAFKKWLRKEIERRGGVPTKHLINDLLRHLKCLDTKKELCRTLDLMYGKEWREFQKQIEWLKKKKKLSP